MTLMTTEMITLLLTTPQMKMGKNKIRLDHEDACEITRKYLKTKFVRIGFELMIMITLMLDTADSGKNEAALLLDDDDDDDNDDVVDDHEGSLLSTYEES